MFKYIHKKQRGIFIFSAIILATIIFGAGYLTAKQRLRTHNFANIAYSEAAKKSSIDVEDKDDFDFNLYFEVWHNLKSYYFHKNKLSDRDLFYSSIKGLAEATEDPYTVFMDPDLTTEFYEDLSGTFDGIGAEVGIRDDVLTVIAPLSDTPAERAGLRAGDKIYAIDNESSLGLSLDAAVKKIRGERGTDVSLTIIRNGGKPFDLTITRDNIYVASITSEEKNGLYIIKINSFNDDTEKIFNETVRDILLKQPKGIILDLRNNPGGYLSTAVQVASEWIAAGPVVVEQFGENKREEFFSTGKARLQNFPTVVLINQGSASASEIVAGALRDYKKATIVGMTSFGKGSVQSIQDLSNGSALKITVANWLTPAGDYIDEKGIEPDIEISIEEDDILNNRDPQLDKAIEILK